MLWTKVASALEGLKQIVGVQYVRLPGLWDRPYVVCLLYRRDTMYYEAATSSAPSAVP